MNGLIDMEMFLSHSNLPFSDALLEDMRNKREQLAQGQIDPGAAVQGLTQNFAQESGVNPNKINQLYQATKRG